MARRRRRSRTPEPEPPARLAWLAAILAAALVVASDDLYAVTALVCLHVLSHDL